MSKAVKNWTPNQERFIDWLALPEDMRNPQFQSDIASELGVRQETLSRWKRDKGLTAEASKRARDLLKGDLPEIYGALKREAKAGSFQHIKLALEVAGEHTDTVDVNVSDARERLKSKLGSQDELASRRGARAAS